MVKHNKSGEKRRKSYDTNIEVRSFKTSMALKDVIKNISFYKFKICYSPLNFISHNKGWFSYALPSDGL